MTSSRTMPSLQFPKSVNVFEVGPRDGLQNEQRAISFKARMQLILGMKESGLRDIEAGAFVREDLVPQMKNSERVFHRVMNDPAFFGPNYWALVPNRRGLERAVNCGVKTIGVFISVSESFSLKNTGMTLKEAYSEVQHVLREAARLKVRARAYLSTVYACPFEGDQKPQRAVDATKRLLDWGAEQVSLGDTIGVATPRSVDQILSRLLPVHQPDHIAVHFHDTRGTALANSLRSLEYGVRNIDSSAGGLGGCPFAPGATGNLATEDLVYMLNGMKIRSGVDLDYLSATSIQFAATVKRPISSRYLLAHLAKCSSSYFAKNRNR